MSAFLSALVVSLFVSPCMAHTVIPVVIIIINHHQNCAMIEVLAPYPRIPAYDVQNGGTW